MGFTYDKFITEQTLEGKQNAVREKLLLQALILNEEQAETYGDIITEIKDISSVSLNQQQYLKDCQLHIAEACHADISQISVKATTEERLGFTGREEGISAHCVALLIKAE